MLVVLEVLQLKLMHGYERVYIKVVLSDILRDSPWRNDSFLHSVHSQSILTSNSTSSTRYNKKFNASSKHTEGCFCPDGTTLFNTVYETCVTSCGKKGPQSNIALTRISWLTYIMTK